jgi:N-acetylmuramoyl-L-alanine amidase
MALRRSVTCRSNNIWPEIDGVIGVLAMSLLIGHCASPVARPAFTVVVDAGHGGRDGGAYSSAGGRPEKEATLAIATSVARKLGSSKQIVVIMTRADDRYLSLVARQRIIRSCEPDLVISIHADSGPPAVRGAAVFLLNEQGQAVVVDRMMSRTRKDADDELSFILADIRQRQSINYVAPIASQIQLAIGPRIGRGGLPRFANLALLKVPGTPSLLIECGFVSNSADAVDLFTSEGQDRIAGAIAAPILDAARRSKLRF